MVTFCKNCFYISISTYIVCTEVSLVVCANRAKASPVIFRMHKNRIILRCTEIKNRFKDLILDLHKLHCFLNCFLRSSCYDCSCISNETYSLVKDQTVIRAWFRIGLTCHCKSLIRTIFICKNTFDSRHCLGTCCINIFNQCMCIWTSDHLNDQAV